MNLIGGCPALPIWGIPKGVGLMATTLSTTIQCPAMCCTCGGAEQVEALTSPTAKTVRITACASLLAQGWRGHQLAVAKTDVATLARYGVTA